MLIDGLAWLQIRTGAPIVMEYPPYVNAYDNFVNNRGGKIQWITEVTKDNLSYIKKLMQYAQIRHMDNIKGFAFGVSETEYVATEVMQVAQPLAELTYSNMKVIVEAGSSIFFRICGIRQLQPSKR